MYLFLPGSTVVTSGRKETNMNNVFDELLYIAVGISEML